MLADRADGVLGRALKRIAILAAALLFYAAVEPSGQAADDPSGSRRFALLIANGTYPDANAPVPSASKDAKLLSDELKRSGFEVDVKEDLNKRDMQAAIDAFTAKVTPGSAALLYFNGFGIQVARQSYLIPVDAQIWSEAEVKRDGIAIDTVLSELNRRGARIKIVILDASRRNPYERRFRPFSAGLAGVDASEGTLALYAAAPGKTAPDPTGDTSLFMSELTKELRAPEISAEEVFTHTRVGVSRASNGEQVPWVASSLVEDFFFGKPQEGGSGQPGDVMADMPPSPPVVKAKPPATKPPPQVQLPPPQVQIPPQAQLPPEVPPPEVQPTPEVQPQPQSQPPPPQTQAQTQPAQQQPQPSQPPAQQPTPPPAPPTPPPAPPSAQPSVAMNVPQPQAAPPAADQAAKPGDVFRDCSDCPEMVALAGGTFDMGSGTTPYDRPVHRVVIKPFAMAANEVTFDDWQVCVAAGGCSFKPDDLGWGGGERPVINASWLDAKSYAVWLSKETGRAYRLPSEAEWEYAARAGTTTPFAWGTAVGSGLANCRDCQSGATRQTLPARSFQPNKFGLYDLAGNAAEWVEDCWNESYRGAPKDGSAWTTGECQQRVLRGGSFDSTSAYARPTARFRYDMDVRYYANGFRVARSLP